MPHPDDASLILGSGHQFALIPEAVLDEAGLPPAAYASEEERGRFTGTRLFLSNPKLYSAIVKLLARGETYRTIADICEVSTQTVTGVARRESIPVETLRERLGKLGLDVARLSLEAMMELLTDPGNAGKFSLKDLAIVHGIATSNSQLLLGGATARVETREVVEPGHNDYLLALKEAGERAMRNVTPVSTGLHAGNPEANGGARGSAGALGNGSITVELPDHAAQAVPRERSDDAKTPTK